MFIVSKDNKAIINLDQIATMYIGSDGCSVKADYKGGNGCQLGRYNSDQEARKAVRIVADSIGKTEVCYMPDDDSVKAKMNLEEQKYHHITGKKNKGAWRVIIWIMQAGLNRGRSLRVISIMPRW